VVLLQAEKSTRFPTPIAVVRVQKCNAVQFGGHTRTVIGKVSPKNTHLANCARTPADDVKCETELLK
jgi:hypothetical protein